MHFVIVFGFQKIPQKYPQQFCHFLGVGDDFSYENKFQYIGMFSTSILRCMKKNQTFAKTILLFSST
jgi:hypothetical protein